MKCKQCERDNCPRENSPFKGLTEEYLEKEDIDQKARDEYDCHLHSPTSGEWKKRAMKAESRLARICRFYLINPDHWDHDHWDKQEFSESTEVSLVSVSECGNIISVSSED